MPSRTAQIAQVGKRQIELSNLTKVLYPDEQIVKAEVIQYYLKIAPTILAHIKGRPLSLVRYPDGINGESFFQKNLPGWAPDWLEHVTLGEEKKNYVIASEEASLGWLANLACLELHQMHSRAPHFGNPDYIVYDLDPPESFKFPDMAGLALEFKEHLERFGYHPFVKTTGRKGLHVVTPIESKWGFDKAFEAAKAIAQPFVDSHGSSLTLQIKKEHRHGKVLLDIYRNRPSQTIISAYSLRGLPGATVSTPLQWGELTGVETPKVLNLHTLPGRVIENGDPWEAIAAYATAIHTERKPMARRDKGKSLLSAEKRVGEDNQPVLEQGSRREVSGKAERKYKTPEQLETYSKKRSFNKTPEPAPAPITGQGNAFVVHRHHASRLHYDLRLEQKGVLKSWAVPKGLPPRPGIMRLAVNVEDHPLEYVHFEGAIPKGEYGGGMMWKFAQGRYEITKEKKGGFYFRLQSRELNAEYRTHQTKDNQWLLERVDAPQTDWLRDPIEPMLARSADQLPESPDYLYEVKWDGIRAMISLDEGQIRIHGRNRMEFTKQFPELVIPEQAFRATSALFDGEIVCLDAEGRPKFQHVIQRMQQSSEGAIERARLKHPAVCYLFDCLYLDGRPIVIEPLSRRREWLADAVKKDCAYRVSEVVEDGPAFFEAVKELGLEGIMAKQRNSTYQPGKRSDTWLKIKTRQSVECVIIGYTQGRGDRQASFGALHLAQTDGGGGLRYIGKVGGGFDDSLLKSVFAEVHKLPTIKRPVKEKPLDDARSVWVEPRLMCEVSFASWTGDGMLREPVFIRLRPDLTWHS
ncbi:MAG TPA: non-homologous end-joining DNA ligase [Candidatus Limnocylindrales bacterium]|nr:non-homologous end-joining DNA ligase [Candidatus Limnocylindrales bacterium]